MLVLHGSFVDYCCCCQMKIDIHPSTNWQWHQKMDENFGAKFVVRIYQVFGFVNDANCSHLCHLLRDKMLFSSPAICFDNLSKRFVFGPFSICITHCVCVCACLVHVCAWHCMRTFERENSMNEHLIVRMPLISQHIQKSLLVDKVLPLPRQESDSIESFDKSHRKKNNRNNQCVCIV